MDKMITQQNGSTTISNDGATIINLLDVAHPAARLLVDIAKAQDNEVGDGTTSVVVLAGELLVLAKTFVDEGMNPQVIIRGYKEAVSFALKALNSLKINYSDTPAKKREALIKCAQTSLNSKLLCHSREFFAEMVVKAVELLDDQLLDKSLIGVKQVTGGSVTESFLVDGVAFKKTFSYAGFEQQPKRFENAKILLLNIELELKSEKENAEIRISSAEEYQSIVDAEWKLIYEKLQKIVDCGAQVVLSKLPIGDLATQYFADRNVFCAGRVQKDDIERVSKATGALIQTTTNGMTSHVLGTCGLFEEVQIGAERFNIFKGCASTKTATIVLRGGAEQFIQEAERSLNDAIMIVRRAIRTHEIVAGGGATEMEVSKHLRDYAQKVATKEQIPINAFGRALETIPRTLADNAGIDSVEVLNLLRQRHSNSSGKQQQLVLYNGPKNRKIRWS